MSYEQKYKDALERAKTLYENANGMILKRWVEQVFPELKESEDTGKPNGGIILEDFNEGEGFYKVNLAYLNKEQVEEIEGLIKKWNLELKESEDETIRKELIEFVHQYGDNYYGQISKASAISWLEKQGNVKHTCRNCQTYRRIHGVRIARL